MSMQVSWATRCGILVACQIHSLWMNCVAKTEMQRPDTGPSDIGSRLGGSNAQE